MILDGFLNQASIIMIGDIGRSAVGGSKLNWFKSHGFFFFSPSNLLNYFETSSGTYSGLDDQSITLTALLRDLPCFSCLPP